MVKGSRIPEITNLRAFAILVVMLNHSIILYCNWSKYHSIYNVYFLEQLKIWFNYFHMPLFFSISGFVFQKTWRHGKLPALLRAKAYRLLVPWFCNVIFWMIPIRKLVGYKGYAGIGIFEIVLKKILTGKDDGHLWFLPCLFVCIVLSYMYNSILGRIEKGDIWKRLLGLFIAYAVFRKAYLLRSFGQFGVIRDTINYCMYFQLGSLIFSLWGHFRRNMKTHICGILLLLACTYIGMYIPIPPLSHWLNLLRALFVVSFYLIAPGKTGKFTETLSAYSFGLYLFHSPMLYFVFRYMANANPALVVSLNFFGLGGLAFFITYLFKHSKLGFVIGEPVPWTTAHH